MRAALFTYGSRGEFQPFLVLAAALRDAGHDVILAAPPNPGFEDLASEHDVPFVAIGRSWHAGDVRALVQDRLRVNDPLQIMRLISEELMLRDIEEQYARAMDAARGRDVIVSHYGYPLGRMCADTLRVPYVAVVLDPNSIPTETQPPLEPAPDAPRWARFVSRGALRRFTGRRGNRALWRATMLRYQRALVPGINVARQRVGLRPLRIDAPDALRSPELNLVPVSPSVLPQPPDWSRRDRMTGYWLFADGRPPPDEVRSFIAAGPPPVAVSLGGVQGTLPTDDSDRVTAVIIEAVQRAGVRAILEPGGRELGSGQLPDTVLRASVSHAWLFPRVAAVIHHGGVGTTAAAIRAGVPSVIVPHRWDQPFWAARAHCLGVAAAPVPFGQLSPEALCAALADALANPAMLAATSRLAGAVRSERGPEVAVRLIEERVFASQRRPAPKAAMPVAAGSR